MKVLEYALNGKYIATHKNLDTIPEDYDIDEIIRCLNGKKLCYKDRIWITPSTELGVFNKRLMLIKSTGLLKNSRLAKENK
jgi:hypothetical protein